MATSDADSGQIPLMLIHGAWLSARSWENYADYFAKRGFAVSAPEWPRKQGDVEELRETAEASAGLGVREIVDHYEQLIRDLDQPPVLIGHSYGGLFVELLLDRGLGRAGVAMSPAPPKGILKLPFSTLKAGAPALAHPSKWHGVVTLTLEEFTYGFVNTLLRGGGGRRVRAVRGPGDRADLLRGRVRQLPPASADRGPLQERRAGAAADRRCRRGPHRSGLPVASAQYKSYERSPAKTDYLEFDGRPHLFMVAADWQEVAAAVDSWLDGVLDVPDVSAHDIAGNVKPDASHRRVLARPVARWS